MSDFADLARQVLADLRDRTGVTAWHVTRHRADDQVLLASVGSLPSDEGRVGPTRWQDSFCAAVVDGRAPEFCGEVSADPELGSARERNGHDAEAVVSVPLRAADGTVLGTLCGMDPDARPDLPAMAATVRVQAATLGALLSQDLRLGQESRRRERAEVASHTDALTGLGNRRAWDAVLAAEEDRAAGLAIPTSVLVLDLDGLKTTNDSTGHHAGDHLLRRGAALLRDLVREEDVLARTGGDEFAVLLVETGVADARRLAARLQSALDAAGVEASVGVAERDDAGLHAAWRAADAAMYADKTARRGRALPVVAVPARTAEEVARHAPPREEDSPVARLLRLVLDQLGTEVAYVTRFGEHGVLVRDVVRTADVPMEAGRTHPTEGTYCRLIADGKVPQVVPDALRVPLLTAVPATAVLGVRTHVGVPLRTSDGREYGSLCTFKRTADETVGERERMVLQAVADLAMRVIEAEDAEAAERHEVLSRVHRLLASAGPEIVVQPVVELATMRTTGYEALSRFPAGTPSPDRWFADAHVVGVGVDLELRAVRNALALADRLDADLGVNASPAALLSPGFTALLEPVALDRVVVEVTEHAAVDDYTALSAVLDPLRARGLRIAVDDAGAGFASMRHVLHLVPEVVKLDVSLTRGIDADRSCQAMTTALTTFAASTGARAVAEGVETQAELDCLRRLGVHAAQGYFLARPHPVPPRS